MSEPNFPRDPIEPDEPTIPPTNAADQTADARRAFRKSYYLGAAAGILLPLAMIIVKIIMCNYGLSEIGDVFSAFGWCALPPALAGAVITAAATSIGRSAGRRADARQGDSHRTARGQRTGLWIGIVISFLLGAVPALMVLFPDC